MLTRFKHLYQRYLEGVLSRSEAYEFRSEVGSVNNEELWSAMLEADEKLPSGEMPAMLKDQVADRLHMMIMRRRWYAVLKYAAAAVAFVVGAGALLSPPDSHYQMVASVKPGSKSEVTLPDGTVVQLNSASEITFDWDGSHERTVRLHGEAFFDVAKDPERAFRVLVDDMQVEVHGTTFNVNAYDPSRVETALLSGKVTITGSQLRSTSYELLPGEKAVFDRTDGTITIDKADMQLATGWLHEYLVFDGEPLLEVIKRIERWYGVDIELRRSDLGGDLLTGSYRHENIHNVMHSLSVQYSFKYDIEKDHIIIY